MQTNQLWSHKRGGPTGGLHLLLRARDDPADAKVDDLDLTATGRKEILWLDVAVDNVFKVQVLDAAEDPTEKNTCVLLCKRIAALAAVHEGSLVAVLLHDIHFVCLGIVDDLVELYHIRMV